VAKSLATMLLLS